jgi:hypothetical protein
MASESIVELKRLHLAYIHDTKQPKPNPPVAVPSKNAATSDEVAKVPGISRDKVAPVKTKPQTPPETKTQAAVNAPAIFRTKRNTTKAINRQAAEPRSSKPIENNGPIEF